MAYSKPARTTTRRVPRILVAGLLVVSAAIAAALGYESTVPSSSTAASPIAVSRSELRGAPSTAISPIDVPRSEHPPAPTSSTLGAPIDLPRIERRVRRGAPGGALGEADGAVPDGTTVFDDEVPGVVKLDPALLGALRRAATNAAGYGVEFYVDSGWRSPKYQEQLLHEAVSEYGSEKEAARWVATPNTSPHVSGDAVDIGPVDATAWLSGHGAKYGLCQIYRNEPWHYELRPKAIDHGCPPMYADPTQDPTMQQ
jgi:zinc D-Ala-D-Ala carboxypeptidase